VQTLRANVAGWPGWTEAKAQELKPMDVKAFLDSDEHISLGLEEGELDLLAGGVPCPPFSLAGKRLGREDERDLFPDALKIVRRLQPKAVMIENVRGILEPPEVFIEYRAEILDELREAGYSVPEIDVSSSPARQDLIMRKVWRRLDASDFGVPQLRPRAILVAIRNDVLKESPFGFVWPKRLEGKSATVASELDKTMRERCEDFWDKNKWGKPAKPGERTGKDVYEEWRRTAVEAETFGRGIAPTLVGGSRKHGGADLGPTRAKRAWAALGIDAMGVATDREECDPERDLFRDKGPMLTVEQAAIIQGFPRDWKFQGRKTARYRQVGNAFPPPVAEAVGRAIAAVLRPECRQELLKGYVMETGEVESPELIPEQMEFPVSGASPQARAAREDSVSDCVSAGV
jgi:DNA (cytosine-5)-methyltransferase 1